jgi:hypothetical protein
MKKFFCLLILFLVGTSIFSQANIVDIQPGRTYIVRSIDGSGQVGIYSAGAGVPADYIPDGTEVRAMSGIAHNRVQVAVPGAGAARYIDPANIAEETAASIAARAEARRSERRGGAASFLTLAFAIAGAVLLRNISRQRIHKIFNDYYTAKRKEYPWLETWISQNEDPAPIRIKEAISDTSFWMTVLTVIMSS